MKRIIALALTTIGLATIAPAQPVTPEQTYLVGSRLGLFSYDPVAQQASTLMTVGSIENIGGLAMNAGNLTAAVLFNDNDGKRLLTYSPTTGLTTLIAQTGITTPTSAILLDQDGRLVIAGGTSRVILKTAGLLNNALTTLVATLPGRGVAGMCIDDDNGDYMIATSGATNACMVLRLNARTLALSTIASGLSHLTAIDHDQTTGRFVVTSSAAPHVQILDRGGRLLNSRNLNESQDVWVDDVTGRFHVLDDDRIVVLDRGLQIISQVGPLPIDSTSLVLWGHRKVGPAPAIIHSGGRRGTKYSVQGQFYQSPNKTYACSISLGGLRPGVGVGQRTINIAPDALFFATVEGRVPLFTTSFVGTTTATGRFTASFVVPPLSTTSGIVHFAAAVVNTAKPDNLDLAPSIAIRVLP